MIKSCEVIITKRLNMLTLRFFPPFNFFAKPSIFSKLGQLKSVVSLTTLALFAYSTDIKAADFNFSQFNVNDLEVNYGLSLGASLINPGAENFNLEGQNVSADIDGGSPQAFFFFGFPVRDDVGVEFSVGSLGEYDFEANISGDGLSELSGSQSYLAYGASVYSKKNLTSEWKSKVHLGVMGLRLETKGEANVIGQNTESLDYTENSGNAFITFEANRQLYKEWYIGPSLTIINAGDRFDLISVKVSRSVNH
jgi:hypothetical protein